ncbi:hypothetical protein, partial [Legionella sp. PL877]
MKNTRKIDKASSVFFFLGFVTSQLRHSSFLLLAVSANIASLLFYSIGYVLWLIACQLYPEHPPHRDYWYGFAQLKNQHRTAAALGGAALVCCLLGFAFPIALLFASWLFLLSNIIWCIGEYHKKQNPPTYDHNYSSTQQEAYLRYAVISTLMSLVPAITASICLFFPPATLFALLISVSLGFLLGTSALCSWIDCNLNEHKPDMLQKHPELIESYDILSQTLGAGQKPASEENNPSFQQSTSSLWSNPDKCPNHEQSENILPPYIPKINQ